MAQVTWDRRFRTTQERRANQPDEDGWWCRPKRRPHRIPCSYWDLPRRTQRCWKAQRNTQHRLRPVFFVLTLINFSAGAYLD